MVNTLRDGVTVLTFGKLISEAGFNANDFPVLSETPISLFDRKKRLLKAENLDFRRKLFSKNDISKKKFRNLLKQIEGKDFSDKEITGTLSDDALVLYIPGHALADFFFLF